MKELYKIGFKRCLVPPETPELPVPCVFSDSSQEAFGTRAYIRQKTKQGTFEVKLVTAKSREAKTYTSYRVDKVISREDMPQQKRTQWTRRTSHA